MEQRKRLTASIYRNVLGFWLFHTTVFVCIAIIYHFQVYFLIAYLLSSVAISLIMLGILMFARHHFYLLETGVALDHVNVANKLTLFRISSLPSILMLFIASRTAPIAIILIIYAGLAFISDLLDGFVSRKTHQTTRVGQYIDSMSDYAVLLGVAIAFASSGFISIWFFCLVLVRFISQWVSMGILFVMKRGTIEPRFSFLGKASVAVTMIAFAVDLLRLLSWFQPYLFLLFWIELLASAVLVISLVEKTLLFVGDLRSTIKQNSSLVQ